MTETAVETPTYRHFIAGEWVDSTSGATFESVNPADTRDIVGRFQQGTKADVAMAIKAAETAGPMWRRTPAPKPEPDKAKAGSEHEATKEKAQDKAKTEPEKPQSKRAPSRRSAGPFVDKPLDKALEVVRSKLVSH